MHGAIPTAASVALGAAMAAALCDWQRGRIPNWLTLPPIVLAPLAYGWASGPAHALHSLGAAILSAGVPYLLFRRSAMGGGDVKLFAALGAVTGFDLLAGIEIQLAAFAVAMFVALGVLAWKGVLLRTLSSALTVALRPILPNRWRRTPCVELAAEIRMGVPILIATVFFAVPHLLSAWSEP
ncbi:MAG: A24 family peptidase [Polyangiales bacterium]